MVGKFAWCPSSLYPDALENVEKIGQSMIIALFSFRVIPKVSTSPSKRVHRNFENEFPWLQHISCVPLLISHFCFGCLDNKFMVVTGGQTVERWIMGTLFYWIRM